MNDWLESLDEEVILDYFFRTQIDFGGGGGELHHAFVIYTPE